MQGARGRCSLCYAVVRCVCWIVARGAYDVGGSAWVWVWVTVTDVDLGPCEGMRFLLLYGVRARGCH